MLSKCFILFDHKLTVTELSCTTVVTDYSSKTGRQWQNSESQNWSRICGVDTSGFQVLRIEIQKEWCVFMAVGTSPRWLFLHGEAKRLKPLCPKWAPPSFSHWQMGVGWQNSLPASAPRPSLAAGLPVNVLHPLTTHTAQPHTREVG